MALIPVIAHPNFKLDLKLTLTLILNIAPLSRSDDLKSDLNHNSDFQVNIEPYFDKLTLQPETNQSNIPSAQGLADLDFIVYM